jgi:hypothetical protein
MRGGAMHAGRGYAGRGYAGRVRPAHPIAGRPGYGVAGRAGYAGRYPYRGYGAAAAVGAAAVGAAAYGSYNNCYDAYGNWVCNGQYPY